MSTLFIVAFIVGLVLVVLIGEWESRILAKECLAHPERQPKLNEKFISNEEITQLMRR